MFTNKLYNLTNKQLYNLTRKNYCIFKITEKGVDTARGMRHHWDMLIQEYNKIITNLIIFKPTNPIHKLIRLHLNVRIS